MANVTPQALSAQTVFLQKGFSDMDMIGVPTGFQSFFGRPGTGGQTNFVTKTLSISQDIMRGENTVSKIFQRETGGSWDTGTNTNAIKGDRFKNTTRVFPLMEEYFSVSHDQTLEKRQFSENPVREGAGEGMELIQIRRNILMAEGKMAVQKMMRKNEIMCSEAIRLGTQTLDDGQVYNYDRATTNTFAAALVWTNAAALIIEEIDDLIDVAKQNGKVQPNFLLPGSGAWGAMVKQLIVQNISDNRGYMFVRAGDEKILPQLPADVQWMVGAGFAHVGWVQTYKGRKLPIFTYDEQYQDASKNWQDIMPVDEVTVGWSGARCDRSFGPSLTFEGNLTQERQVNELLGFGAFTAQMPTNMKTQGAFDPRMFHVDGKVNSGNNVISMRLSSGGIYVPVHTDAFATLTGVV